MQTNLVLVLLALVFPVKADGTGFIEVPVTIHEGMAAHGLARRQAVSGPVENLRNFYYGAQVEIGTPPQKVQVTLDTCSSDLFVFGSHSNHPFQFNKEASKTCQLVPNQPQYSASFEPEGISAVGNFYKDNVSFYGAQVTQQFAIIEQDVPHVFDGLAGLFGIGGQLLEGTTQKYKNFPSQLLAEGVIDHLGYSVYLNERNASTGTIVFGGVDTEKYSGSMYWLKNRRPRNTFFGVDVTVNGISDVAMLDTGTQFVYLKPEIIDSITQQLSATYDPARGLIVPNLPAKLPQFVFQFGKLTITVPYEEFLQDPGNPHVVALFKTSESGGIPLLGASFLRSVYVVYDFQRNQAAIAPVKITTKSSIVPLSQGIPNAVDPSRGRFWPFFN